MHNIFFPNSLMLLSNACIGTSYLSMSANLSPYITSNSFLLRNLIGRENDLKTPLLPSPLCQINGIENDMETGKIAGG